MKRCLASIRAAIPASLDQLQRSQPCKLLRKGGLVHADLFRQWADSRDLVNTSYLNPAPPGLYLTKALKFADGHPGLVVRLCLSG